MFKTKTVRAVISSAIVLSLLCSMFVNSTLSLMKVSAVTDTNLLLTTNRDPAVTGKICKVPFEFSWDKSYPEDFQYSRLTETEFGLFEDIPQNKISSNSNAFNATALYDNYWSSWEADHPAQQLRVKDKVKEDTRWAFLYDLGSANSLSEININALSSGNKQGQGDGDIIYNYSVYGSLNKSDLLDSGSLLGRGGDAWKNGTVVAKDDVVPKTTAATEYKAQLDSAKNVRYVLIIFERLGSENRLGRDGNGAYQYDDTIDWRGRSYNANDALYAGGSVTLNEIQLTGHKVEGVDLPEEPNVVNAIKGKKGVKYDVPFEFSWQKSYPDDFTYTSLSVAGSKFQNNVDKWTDEDFDKTQGDADSGETVEAGKRRAVLYDLGGYYKLNEVSVWQRKDVSNDYGKAYVHNYSVYAGNSASADILENCVARGGTAWDSATNKLIEKDKIKTNSEELYTSVRDNEAYRYVLIVFDRVGNDPGNANLPADAPEEDDRPETGAYPGYNYYTEGVNAKLPNYNKGSLQLREIVIKGSLEAELKPNVLAELDEAEKLEGGMYVIPHKYDKNNTENVTYSSMTDMKIDLLNTTRYKNYAFDGKSLFDGNTVKNTAIGVSSLAYSNRWAMLYNLNTVYQLDDIDLYGPGQVGTGDDAVDYTAYHVSVYGGMAQEDLLKAENLLGKGKSDKQSGYLRVSLDSSKKVQYVLIVFDKLGTDALIVDTENVKPDTKNDGSNHTHAGELSLAEIELHGTATADKAVKAEKKVDLLTQLNQEGKLQSYVYRLYRNYFDWSEDYPSAYEYDLNQDVFDATEEIKNDFAVEKLFDDSGATGAGNYGHGTDWRWALMFDLGDWYDLTSLDLTCGMSSLLDRFYLYNISVYGGSSKDQSVFANLMGRAGDAWDSENNKQLTKDEVLAAGHKYEHNIKLTSKYGAVRYVMVTFDRMGSDFGNANAQMNADAEYGLPGYFAAAGGMSLAELNVYGTKGQNPSKALNKTDEESGIQIDVVTYDNKTEIADVKIERVEATDIEKDALAIGDTDLGPVYAKDNAAYQITYYDKGGQVITDMTGRTVKIAIPYAGEGLFLSDEEANLTLLDETNINNTGFIGDQMYYIYSCATGSPCNRFIVATWDEPAGDFDDDNSGDNNNNGGNNGNDAADNNWTGDGTDKPIETGVGGIGIIIMLFAAAAAITFIVRKRRTRA